LKKAFLKLTQETDQRLLRNTYLFEDFCYAFVHTLSPEAQRAAYDTQVVPESGRIFFQDALAARRGQCRGQNEGVIHQMISPS
jgi:hypothetical protein